MNLTSRKRIEEKSLDEMRKLSSLSFNKQCFDCGQRGPTYVNMTIGSFVCTACSGHLRGLNPPHRVKSISMSSFTPDDVQFFKQHGNFYCRRVWLGLYQAVNNPDMESRDEMRRRDFLMKKYERKQWYVEPTASLREESARLSDEALAAATPATARGGGGVGGGGGRLARPIGGAVALTTRVPAPSAASGTNLSVPNSAASATSKNTDLFGDAAAAPTQASSTSGGGKDQTLADIFAGAFPSAGDGAASAGGNASTFATFPSSAGADWPTTGGAATSHGGAATSHGATVAFGGGVNGIGGASPARVPGTASSRYAALADLDDLFTASTATSIDWGTSSAPITIQAPSNAGGVQMIDWASPVGGGRSAEPAAGGGGFTGHQQLPAPQPASLFTAPFGFQQQPQVAAATASTGPGSFWPPSASGVSLSTSGGSTNPFAAGAQLQPNPAAFGARPNTGFNPFQTAAAAPPPAYGHVFPASALQQQPPPHSNTNPFLNSVPAKASSTNPFL